MSGEPQEFGRDMSPFDTGLYRGDENPRTRAQLTALYVLDRTPSRERLAASFERASRLFLRLRQRVVSPPVSWVLPCWIVDPDFDLGYHLRFSSVSAPGSMSELLALVQQQAMTRLDPDRPLWNASLIEGLPEGRAALVFGISHAITDGMGARRLFTTLYDAQRDPEPAPLPPPPIPEDVTPEELLRAAIRHAPFAAARVAAGLGHSLLGLADRLIANPQGTIGELQALAGSFRRVLGAQAAHSPALRGRSLARRCIAFEAPLAQVKSAGRKLDASVNDVFLAGLCGALQRYHERLGVHIEALPMAVPVNLRRGSEGAAGNYFGVVSLAAPLATSDPRERIALIRERVRAGRAEAAVDAPNRIAPLLARLPSPLLQGLLERTPRPDVQASSVPGPSEPLYVAGARVTQAYAFGPVPDVAMMFVMNSLAGTCYFGGTFDPAAVTEPTALVECLEAAFNEVLKLGSARAHVSPPVLGGALLPQAPA